jgi:hypothetical protein
MPLSAADHALGELLLHKYDRGKGAEREKVHLCVMHLYICY